MMDNTYNSNISIHMYVRVGPVQNASFALILWYVVGNFLAIVGIGPILDKYL